MSLARIQLSMDTAAEFETNNPIILPGEVILVVQADGKVAMKVNRSLTQARYKDVPTIYSESVASQLLQSLDTARDYANAAKNSETAASNHAKTVEAVAKSINDKTILATTDGLAFKLNTEDFGLDVAIESEA